MLYGWPHRWLKSRRYSGFRTCWWSLSFALAIPLLNYAVTNRHPYLNPFSPDHDRLAAERVLALNDLIVGGRNADWVLCYARRLEKEGQTKEAIHFYREGLRLDPGNSEAATRLANLESQSAGEKLLSGKELVNRASAPYWKSETAINKSPRCQIGPQLEDVEGCTVVIVSVGTNSDTLLDAVAYAIRNELELPVWISSDPIPLPEHTRVRGVVTGNQWDQAVIVQSFINITKPFPYAPVKFLLVNWSRHHWEDANYLFSTSYSWGGLVSSARFEDPKGGDSLTPPYGKTGIMRLKQKLRIACISRPSLCHELREISGGF